MTLEARVRALLERGEADEAASAALEALGPSLLGFLGSLFEEDDARDVFSVFAEDLWRGLGGFRFECSLRTWAYRLARNAAARYRKQAWRRRAERFPTSMASRLAASIADSNQLPGGRRDALRRLRESLDEEDQLLLSLRLDRELEWEELAGLLSADGPPVTAAALRKRFERLKERLGRMAQDAGLLG
jgi:RNA polymerase sigma-70 factor (ECF subfamily)